MKQLPTDMSSLAKKRLFRDTHSKVDLWKCANVIFKRMKQKKTTVPFVVLADDPINTVPFVVLADDPINTVPFVVLADDPINTVPFVVLADDPINTVPFVVLTDDPINFFADSESDTGDRVKFRSTARGGSPTQFLCVGRGSLTLGHRSGEGNEEIAVMCGN